jgi:SAM-dependent methyltransferase
MDSTQLAKTRRRLRSKGTTRRRTLLNGGIVKINGDAVSAILTPIYNALPITKAAGQHNLTYGEIEWATLKLILDYTEKQSWPTTSPGRFYDLGCGRGRAVLYMALAGPFEFSVGVEVLPERVSLAQQALTKLKAAIPTAGAKVKLYEASFLNPAFKYKDARVVFLSNMCFDEETQKALFYKLNTDMQKGSLVFCSRTPSPLPSAFELVGMERVPMTWTPSSELHILRHL